MTRRAAGSLRKNGTEYVTIQVSPPPESKYGADQTGCAGIGGTSIPRLLAIGVALAREIGVRDDTAAAKEYGAKGRALASLLTSTAIVEP